MVAARIHAWEPQGYTISPFGVGSKHHFTSLSSMPCHLFHTSRLSLTGHLISCSVHKEDRGRDELRALRQMEIEVEWRLERIP